MSDAKHTPTIWERLPGTVEAGHPIYKPGKTVIRIVLKRPPGVTAFVPVALVDSDRAWEDARLIAAAPELLEALQGAVGALEFSRDYHSDLSNAEQAFAQDRLDAALKAIAKATGEAA